MYKLKGSSLGFALLTSLALLGYGAEDMQRVIWDTDQALDWEQTYPVGTGRLGATAAGGFPQEQIVMNEDSIWGRNPVKMNPLAREGIREVRELARLGKYAEAETVFKKKIHSGFYPRSYETLGTLLIRHLDYQPVVKSDFKWARDDGNTGLAVEKGTEVAFSTSFTLSKAEFQALRHNAVWRVNGMYARASVRLEINGKHAGSLGQRSQYGVRVEEYLKEGENTVVIRCDARRRGMKMQEGMYIESTRDVTRKLNVMNGVTTTTIAFDDGVITRTMFASHPHDCIVMKIESTRPGGVHVALDMAREDSAARGEPFTLTREKGDLLLTGSAGGEGGTKFVGRVRVLPQEGTTNVDDKTLHVKAPESVVILITAATDYNRVDPDTKLTNDLAAEASAILDKAATVSWETLKKAAVDDISALMNRCELDVGTTPEAIAALPTPERLKRFKADQNDPDLVELLFQFGRYLLIGSSRPGSLPANLQGVWNPYINAPWASDFHFNINVQMNYWPAEITNLSECHEPFLDFVQRVAPRGAKWAEHMGHDGWCAGLCFGAYMGAYYVGAQASWGANCMNAPWVSSHLIDHYRFTGDKEFLKKIRPTIEGVAQFILSWVEKDPKTGKWIAGPGASPENTFLYTNEDGETVKGAISLGTSIDQMLCWEGLQNYLLVARELNIKSDLVAKSESVLKDLLVPQIGKDGRLMEWMHEFGEAEKGHRHISHMYGFFPGNQINILEHPDKVDAIKKSLAFRLAHGGAGTGWSRAWFINMCARLLDGEGALKHVNEKLGRSMSSNLFGLHPPFQIDGNFGATAGIAEMLIQSHIQVKDEQVIMMLPALPKAWSNGSARGLKARGGLTVESMKWENGSVTELVLKADQDVKFQLRMNGKIEHLSLRKGESYRH